MTIKYIEEELKILQKYNNIKKKKLFEVIFYQKDNGTFPVKEFVSSLDPKMRSKVYKAIQLLKDNGNKIPYPFSKHLKDGVFELRVKFSNDIVRILYFFCKGKIVVLSNAFVKKTQKTPEKEIELAISRKKDYERRKLT